MDPEFSRDSCKMKGSLKRVSDSIRLREADDEGRKGVVETDLVA